MVCSSVGAKGDEPNANAVSFATPADPLILVLDARDASRGLMFAHLSMPVKPGAFTFVYPKWIPGEHGPTGPLNDLAALRVSANGVSIPWSRDPVDLYAFHVIVPLNVSSLDVDFDVLLNAPNDEMSTNHLAVVNWNRDLVYQQDTSSAEVYVKASVLLPAGWDFATALPVAQHNGSRIDFREVPLRTLVDSPLDCGMYARHVELWSSGSSVAQLDVFADDPESLDLSPQLIAPYQRMVSEGLAMYGARHWNSYHALVALSDTISGEGIEHHESSDNRAPSDFISNEQWVLQGGDLIPHEFSHSWNGKYRRPADLTTANFQIPMQTDLLWVYEGMNQYLGDVLSFRAGVRSSKLFPDLIASVYASLDTEPGRLADPLIDTTVAAPWLYEAKGDYSSLRRTTDDFYGEGELIWLDVDTIIRQQTAGAKSLDDFLHAFAGPPDSGPEVVTYTRDDIEHLLTSIAPYDWHDFFQQYVYEVAVHPPSDEVGRAGWRLVYTTDPNVFDSATDEVFHNISEWYSLGLRLDSDGNVTDVREGSPAWSAALAPGMKIVAINQRAFDASLLVSALMEATRSSAPIALLINYEGWYRTYNVGYHGGPRYPHLLRIPGKPDMLAKITAPHAASH
jgi:predicted metalloprotease with PDZ domain